MYTHLIFPILRHVNTITTNSTKAITASITSMTTMKLLIANWESPGSTIVFSLDESVIAIALTSIFIYTETEKSLALGYSFLIVTGLQTLKAWLDSKVKDNFFMHIEIIITIGRGIKIIRLVYL